MMKFTRTNRLMDDCLAEVRAFLADRKSRLPVGDAAGLAALLRADVVFDRGCYLLRWPEANWTPDPDAAFHPTAVEPDRTGREDFENHFHEEWIRGRNSPQLRKPGIHHLVLALLEAEVVRLKLRDAFPTVRFRISVSFVVRPFEDDDDETTALNVMREWRVSFHALRRGEVLFDDLEAFAHDAVGILDMKPERVGKQARLRGRR